MFELPEPNLENNFLWVNKYAVEQTEGTACRFGQPNTNESLRCN